MSTPKFGFGSAGLADLGVLSREGRETMRRQIRKWIPVLVIAGAVAASSAWLGTGAASSAAAPDRPLDTAGLKRLMTSGFKKDGYDDYLSQHKDAPRPDAEIRVEGEAYSGAQGADVSILDHYEGNPGKAVKTGDAGTVSWEFQVDREGLYNIGMKFYPVKGKDSDIERELKIDGSYPFDEAKSFVFPRIWKDANDTIVRDGNGNDLTPVQAEDPKWQETLLHDPTGYQEEPYLFYFSKGKHTLSLTAVKEPIAIDYFELTNVPSTPTYEEVASSYKKQGLKPATGVLLKVQGEAAASKSSPTLTPYADHSSPALEPYHVSKLRNNTMGAYAWRIPGQWIEWEVEAPEDGLYQIAVKNRQNYLQGMSSLRTLYIDGAIPFAEAKRIGFGYAGEWQMKVLGQDEGHRYLFHLTKGKHRIRLEVTLGELAPIIRTVQSAILDLNAMYRKIISFTGTVPDTFRDYNLEQRIPEMTDVFRKQSELLYAIAHIIEGPGGGNSRSAMLNTLAYQLKDMADRPETVPSRIDQFKNNVGGLGAWLFSMSEQPLIIDYFIVSGPDAKLPSPEATAWQKLKDGVMSFAASFYEKYDEIGGKGGSDNPITVWVTSGRDQAQVIKRLIDDRFTPNTGIHVNLKIVSSDILLPSTLAGQGPDIALQIAGGTPVNFASRGAVQDLSVFPDFKEIKKSFNDSAMVPFAYNGGSYALPETQTFPVLFYRKDIIQDELKLNVPQTWDDVYALIPTLLKHNLQFGLPQRSLDANGNDAVTTDIVTLEPSRAYAMFLYQHDGQFYKDGDKASGLDTETAIQQFKQWTELFVNYKLPIQVDFANRFRTGEMPIGITDYTMYNKLSVFAPEIKGLWDFAPVPGVKQADGIIRREVGSGGTAAMMLRQTKNKAAAWEFLKWWTGKDTQVAFGREMEIRMGSAARYPTANLEALYQLPWPTKDLQTLKEQMKWTRGVPEVPGGYLTGRHLDNAFRRVVVQGEDPRETIDYYVKYINDEITAKRKEFGLPYEK